MAVVFVETFTEEGNGLFSRGSCGSPGIDESNPSKNDETPLENPTLDLTKKAQFYVLKLSHTYIYIYI